MELNINMRLNDFLEGSKPEGLKITDKQRKEWINNIEDEIALILGDTDIFYDTMPEELEKNWG